MDPNAKKSILQMARGAIMERADYEMTHLMENIMDPNTSATAKRKLTLTLELKPDDTRQNIAVSVTAKSTLSPPPCMWPTRTPLLRWFRRFPASSVSTVLNRKLPRP